jgi:hypothetical protein
LLNGLTRLFGNATASDGGFRLARAQPVGGAEPPELLALRKQLGLRGTGMAAYEIADTGLVLCNAGIHSAYLARTVACATNTVLGLLRLPRLLLPKTLFALFDSIEEFARGSEALGCPIVSPRTAGFWIPGVPPRILAAMTRSHGAGTLAHELTHAMLSRLSLPTWIDEGLATTAQSRVGYACVMDPRRLAQIFSAKDARCRWLSGELFADADSERIHAAYVHAHRIVGSLLRLKPAAFSIDALGECRASDAGARWLRGQFGLTLDAIFLD